MGSGGETQKRLRDERSYKVVNYRSAIHRLLERAIWVLDQLERHVAICRALGSFDGFEAILVGEEVSDELRDALDLREDAFQVRTYDELVGVPLRAYTARISTARVPDQVQAPTQGRQTGSFAVARLKLRPIHLLAAALAALYIGTFSSPAAAAWRSGPESPAQRQGALSFWTPARMKSARPLSVRPPGAAGGIVGSPGTAASASSAFETVPDPTAPVTSQNGAIFIVLGFGGVGRCSGTSVNAPNYSVVFTAGHCVHEGHRWFGRKWVFVPGYHNGQRPFGVFQAKWLDAPPQWVSGNNENFDVGAAVVSRNERGQRLAAAVGGADIAWGLSPNQSFDVYGYPVAPPFNGATLQHCPQTRFEGHDLLSLLFPGPLNLAVECNVTGGASGGGWFTPDGRLNSVTTYGYPEDPATDFGPYFGKEVGKLFGRAAAVK